MAEEDKEESDRLRKLAEDEAREHLERLLVIEEQENERSQRRKLAEIESQTEFERLWRLKYTELYGGTILGNDLGESFIEENIEGFTDQDIDQQCEEFFFNSPIPFKPRPNDDVDRLIEQNINEMSISVPI